MKLCPCWSLEFQGRFLERLCLKYESLEKTIPLPIETLRLGYGMCLHESESETTGNYLAKLADLPNLKQLDIDNTDPNEPHWPFLEDCRLLHRLSIIKFDKNILRWLNSSGTSIRGLIIAHDYGMLGSIL